ncbi:MAG TPA: hypothetical protein VFS76_02910 [Pyrinomonadaceae bacterium]|nr:hypothetical protein [Pyrinomonadaceae bacterium]
MAYIVVLLLPLLLLAPQVCAGQTREAVERTQLGNLQNYYATQDPSYAKVVARLPDIETTLNQLKDRITAAQAARPGQFETQFSHCLQAVNTALRRTTAARRETEQPQYGNIRALVSIPGEDDENRLEKVLHCGNGLNTSIGRDPGIADALSRLEIIARDVQENFDQIDLGEAESQAKSALARVVPENAPIADSAPGSCDNIDLEQAGFRVRSVQIEDPFKFLPWVKARQNRALQQITTLVQGKPFTYKDAGAKGLDIIERENFLPDTTDQRVKIRVEIVAVRNCTGGELDLVYRIYSTQIMPVLSGRPTERVTERQEPQTAAGQTTVVAPEASPFHFRPIAGYDFTNLLTGGARMEVTSQKFWKLPFKSVLIEGQGNSRKYYFSAGLEGSKESSGDSGGWLANAQWLFNYTNYQLPTGNGEIKGGYLTAQFAGVTKPFFNGNFTFHFGVAVDGGNRQSDVNGVVIAPKTVTDAGVGTLKLYGGVDSRLPHNVFSFSYGLELGSIGPAARIDWRKHIVDARHEFWYSLGNHRLLDLESRFTLGSLQVPGNVPLPERFFGGNNEEFLIASDMWQIRANPVIRAIPGSKFFRTPEGAGSRNFYSYNFTAAYGFWRKTLVPEELTTDPEFSNQLQGAMTSVTSTLQNYYASKDPHYANVVAQLPAAQTALNDLKTAVAAAQAARPGQSVDLFKACTRAVSGASRRVASAITPQAADQYGLVMFLLSDDPDEVQLLKASTTCGTDLNAVIADAAVGSASARVGTLRTEMLAEFNRIDQAKAAKQATADMAFTRRTLNTLFNDVNIYSISPVFVFDVARIGPASGGLGGTRYGPGGGIRFELASVAHFTLGYAWNVKRGPDEGRGNFFFAIGVRDLFH